LLFFSIFKHFIIEVVIIL